MFDRRSVLSLVLAVVLIPGAACARHGRGAAGGGDIDFVPQSGFGASGSFTDGGTITITSSGSVFGTKPYSGKPLLWVPMTTDMNGSTLGRISGSSTWAFLSQLQWTSGCGPTGTPGCASGADWPGDGATGGPGVMSAYVAGFNLSEWSGWTGVTWNDLGQQFYLWRQEEHVGFGHLDAVAGNSYNGVGNYNDKIIRIWSAVSGSENTPDIYWPAGDQRFTVEPCASNCSTLGITTGAPVQYINSTTEGSPDINGSVSIQQSFDGMTSGSGAYNQYATTEMMLEANSNASASSYPPSSQFWYWVVGQNGNQPIENWPILNYQNETTGVAWMFVDSASEASGHGTMTLAYPLQVVVDGTSDCPDCSDMPSGAYVNFGPTYVDDCWCHIVIQDSSTYNSATAREIQIPSSWSASSITMTLRKGAFSSLAGEYLFVIDSTDTAHYVGEFE